MARKRRSRSSFGSRSSGSSTPLREPPRPRKALTLKANCLNNYVSGISKCQFYMDMLHKCRKGPETVSSA